MSELVQLAEKHENAVNHFKTEIVKLKEEIDQLKKNSCHCNDTTTTKTPASVTTTKTPAPVTTPAPTRQVRRKVVKSKKK